MNNPTHSQLSSKFDETKDLISSSLNNQHTHTHARTPRIWWRLIVPVLWRKNWHKYINIFSDHHPSISSLIHLQLQYAGSQTDWLTDWLTYLFGVPHPIHFRLITFVRFWVQRNFQFYSDYFFSIFFSIYFVIHSRHTRAYNFQHPKWHIFSLSNELLNVFGFGTSCLSLSLPAMIYCVDFQK